MAFFRSNLLTYGDLPTSHTFPSISVVLSWDLYNHLGRLHPYQRKADFPGFLPPCGKKECFKEAKDLKQIQSVL